MALKVIVTSEGELFSFAVKSAREAVAELRRLESIGLESGETIDDRMRRIAMTGSQLADAFEIVDAIAGAKADRITSPSEASSSHGEHVGCAPKGETN